LRTDAAACRPGIAFRSSGHPALNRALAIHGQLVAMPGRQAAARGFEEIVASLGKPKSRT